MIARVGEDVNGEASPGTPLPIARFLTPATKVRERRRRTYGDERCGTTLLL